MNNNETPNIRADGPYVVIGATAPLETRQLPDGPYRNQGGVLLTVKGDWACYETGAVAHNRFGVHGAPESYPHSMNMADWSHEKRAKVWAAWRAYLQAKREATQEVVAKAWEAKEARVRAIEAKLTADEIADLKEVYRDDE